MPTFVRFYNRITAPSVDDRGAAMAEYGLLLAFVALVVMAVLSQLGGSLYDTFGFANEKLTEAPGFSVGSASTP